MKLDRDGRPVKVHSLAEQLAESEKCLLETIRERDAAFELLNRLEPQCLDPGTRNEIARLLDRDPVPLLSISRHHV